MTIDELIQELENVRDLLGGRTIVEVWDRDGWTTVKDIRMIRGVLNYARIEGHPHDPVKARLHSVLKGNA